MSEFLFIALLAKSPPWLKGINHTGKKVDLKELDLDKSCIISWNILCGICLLKNIIN